MRRRTLGLASIAFTAALGTARVPGVRAAGRTAILVAPFDLFDTSADQRPAVLADQTRWLHDASARLRAKLVASGRVRAIESTQSRKLLHAIGTDYAHPSTCPECMTAAARKSGARYVFIGTLHKVSDLIIYMKGYLLDARTGEQVMDETFEIKADNLIMLDRAASRMARAIERHIP